MTRIFLTLDKVVLVADSYTWMCPECDAENYDYEKNSHTVQCNMCETRFIVSERVIPSLSTTA